jgi:hypothetical protein
MKKQIFFVTIILFFLSINAFSQDLKKETRVDGISGASTKNYYEKGALTDDGLMTVIKERTAGFVLSTVNPDGSPNAGVFIPGMVSGKILKFGMARNQTRINIERTKLAVLTVYKYDQDAPDEQLKHQGARLYLKLVQASDPEAAKNSKLSVINMEITRIAPLG